MLPIAPYRQSLWVLIDNLDFAYEGRVERFEAFQGYPIIHIASSNDMVVDKVI